MEAQSAALLAALKKPSTVVDQKLELFNVLKSGIKHNRVPDDSQATIVECIRIAISTTTSASLVSAAFSTLSHLIKRLALQNQTSTITSQFHIILPILLERFGDARESHRHAASQILSDLWPLSHTEIETLVRENAMKGTNPRAKEASMQWVVKMNKNEQLPFRAYVPLLVANLEDADAGVRETAKTSVVELFRNAPEHGKANLKKQLVHFNVRKTIANYIISHLEESPEAEMPPPPAPAPTARPISAARAQSLQPDTGFADSMLSEIAPPAEVISMDALHIYTQRELDDIFRDMAPHFEGKESEQNWMARDKSVLKLRRITKGNAPTEFHYPFISGIKSLLDGILKVANTLRTTMATNGCQLVQELAKTLGPAMDPWVEILLQSFIKMCAATKNIAAQNGSTTVEAIISNVSYTHRIMQHVAFASQDKNVQPRTHSANWVKTLIRKHKAHIEHSGGLEQVEKILKKGLTDANPKVRESFRSTYWTFALVWPQKAEAIYETLEKREKNGLDKDPNNPNASLASSQSTAPSSFSKSVGAGGGAARSTLKEKIAEQRRAKLAATKGLPDRPNSAQAAYTPAKSQSSRSLGPRTNSNTSVTSSGNRPPSALGGTTKSAVGSNSSGSLLGGTVRRPTRPRPELTRPATADPYASRRVAKTTTPSMTPEKTPAAATTKKSTVAKSTARSRANTQNSPNISPIRSKSRLGEAGPTHRKTPSGSSRHGSPAVGSGKDEDLTLVKPFVRSQSHHEPSSIPFRQRVGMEQPTNVDSDVDMGDDDNFTMVIPNLARPADHPALRSPPKPSPSPGRLAADSPRLGALKSPRSMGDIGTALGTRSPRMRSPDRPSTRGTDTQEEVQVYEDPFVGDEPVSSSQDSGKPVLEELPLNEKSIDRRQSTESSDSNTIMGNGSEEQFRGHHKTTSTGSVMHSESTESNRAEVMKNKQLLVSGINKIRTRTVEAHMFRRLQDMIKSNQDIWGIDDEKFGELLLASLEYLEAPAESLKTSAMKAANLKVQALATIRAMLSLYRKETARYFSRVLCSVLRTKGQYENTSHIAIDLEATADEIVKYGQTSDCLDAVLLLVEEAPISTPTSSPKSKSSENSVAPVSNRTMTMALTTLSTLIQISGAKNVALTPEQTARLGKLAVRCLEDTDPDVRKADVEVCVSLHERIGGEKEAFWKAVAGAREQHLNLLTYYLAKRMRA
ncbi:ARM repeat-containing protein [Aaosphaeria arxii CBS 175.79]|uniref:ARM repeat-containing protein n=1 Tax=Aaosphaeria arxii CBS 175.79 TaxID=1450172 RepID=A0A6A5XBJ5_9PLEO|nr:ARM repeat-containing protein [Aaosphaeria arxii CBS 175.79]KAF2010332.1 ARM repeat-containing protein [Aaosphaeria arxii CBS 175.79]